MSLLSMAGMANISSARDPYWDNVVALLHFDGIDGSRTFIDETGKVWSPFGNVEISTAQSMFGGSSGRWAASGSYIQMDHTTFDFGVDDFTIEAFVCPILGGDRSVISQRNNGATGWALEIRATGAVWFRGRIGDYYMDERIVTAPNAVVENVWTHIALARRGSVWRIFVGGVQRGLLTDAGALDSGGGAPIRMGRSLQNSENDYNGFVDELRITKGVARYTEDFDPPTRPFPNS